MKKKFLLIGILISLLCACLAVGCSTTRSFEGKLKVTYELEGGVYRNGTSVVQYYDYNEGGSNFIREVGSDSGMAPERAGYRLEGWYRVRTESADGVIYSDKWNFATDELKGESIVLYAHWVKETKHTFEIHYFDDEDNDIVIGSVSAKEGATFESVLPFAERTARRTGYTLIGWTNEDGTPFDLKTAHPGGEEDLAVPVYAKYIEGNFTIVSTAAALEKATAGDIYLTADIDLGGKEFSFGNFNMRKLVGNGHTISNFKLKCSFDKNALDTDFEDESKKGVSASLFGRARGAEITGVNFSFTVEVDTTYTGITGSIYLASLAAAPENATFRDVEVNATYTVKRLPNGRQEEEMVKVASDKGYYKEDANSVFENVKVSFTKKQSD